jgi:uncharacterized RDD family membrane protein YckC
MNVPGSLAERGARLLAASFDELILLGILLPALLGAAPIVIHAVRLDMPTDSAPIDPLLIDPGQMESQLISAMLSGPGFVVSVLALLAWCGITAWLVATNGQTIGKRLVGIKVVRTDGSPASFARIFLLRNVVNFLPTLLPFIGLLYQLVIDPIFIFQDSRRCLHDLIADTTVVRSVSKKGRD